MPDPTTAPVRYGQPDAEYRAVDAASYSTLKHILDSPARYLWEKTHPARKATFNLGHAVHGMVLDVGEPLHVIDAPDWKTRAAREERDAAYESGEVPLLSHQWDQARTCANRVMTHPLAGPILTRPGQSEVSIYWDDETTGLPCKARIDRVTITPDRTHWLVDLKTRGQTANPATFGRHAASYGYHMQAAYYRHGYSLAAGVPFEQVEWLNVVAEIDPPHGVAVCTFDAETMNAGRERWRRALDLLHHCIDTDDWPGYTPTEAAVVTIPRYALTEETP